MYCSSCGNEITKGLNYCNSCGVRVVDPEKAKSRSGLENISTAIGFIGLGGLIGFIFLVRILLERSVDKEPLVIILIAYLATIFGISYMLINLLSGISKESKRDVEFQADLPKSIRPIDTNQLEEPKQSPASVVENTTRTLNKVPIERK